ncbi:PASTA domain-containing protein [Arthrobacter sp. 9AX]|uniref:excalibur calcium-binding domain-containing protein n=1 Tax=Arthrobacter sp. 9AX TaxID=2653131 RepID=UPI0012F16130|nr:excalibur calcium-binding domain-containing protein [Arthrobacter sp. 9AX]VXC50285.1 PASTA domain-containing protein [Arthrobacter sp. 9AX]
MKKTLTLVVLAGLMLTGCGGKQAAVQPTETATAVAAVAEVVAAPGVIGLTLDKATDQLEDLGFTVEAKDSVDGKSIVVKKNWQVVSQDPTDGTKAEKGATVHLGVKSLEKLAEEKAAAEKAAAEKVAAEKAAADAAAAAKAAADKAAADKAAADAAAAQQAAAQAAQQAAKAVPVPVPAPAVPVVPAPAAPAPAAAYYQNCDAVRAAGAAPLYAGQPGFRAALDRNNNGVACE